MASRRQRTITASAPDNTSDNSCEGLEIKVSEPTFEETLEVTEEHEEENIEVFLAMAAADVFEAIQKAEEESGVDNFFDPDFYNQPIRCPAQVVPAKKKPRPNHNVQRVITRSRKS